jgi:hypothetical protein
VSLGGDDCPETVFALPEPSRSRVPAMAEAAVDFA